MPDTGDPWYPFIQPSHSCNKHQAWSASSGWVLAGNQTQAVHMADEKPKTEPTIAILHTQYYTVDAGKI